MSTLAAVLLALIASLTGIDRAVDPGLTAIAERRVVEIQADRGFTHVGADPCCAEVLAWNEGHADPVAHVAEQWRASAPHWSILTDPSLTAIGCAIDTAAAVTYAVCVLAATEQPAPEPAEPERTTGGEVTTTPSSAPSTSSTPPPAPALPDTSMRP